MKKTATILCTLAIFLFTIPSCKKNVVEPKESKFSTKENYIGGTITPKTGTTYISPYMITFQSDSTGKFISSTSVFNGTYTIQKDTLVFITNDKEKTARFAINSQNEITYSYYKAISLEYASTGKFFKNPTSNQFLGKTFKGDQYKFGQADVFNKDFVYKFNMNNPTFGSDQNATTIDDSNSYELYNNAGFRYVNGSIRECGVLINGKLVTLKTSGLFYWGTFTAQ